MTIDWAIKLIQADINDKDIEWDSPLGRAYKISFEALKFRQKVKGWYPTLFPELLPGETPQIDNKSSLHHIKQTLESNEVSK